MERETREEQTRLEMIRLCHGTLDSHTLRVELLERLQTVIPFDALFFSTTDPSTLFFTSSIHNEIPTWALRPFLENEFLQDDFNHFRELVKNRQSVGILSEQTQHELSRSPRYRDILAPLALGDEMRAVFSANASCWGTLCLHQERNAPEYTAPEAAFLTSLTPHIAQGLRKAQLLTNASQATAALDGPGVLILSENYAIMSMNDAAASWLAELTEAERGDKQVLPHSILAVLTRLHIVEHGMTGGLPITPKLTLHAPSGRWLRLYASRMSRPSDQGQIVIVFEIAQPIEITPLLFQAYQLTKR